MKPWFIEDGEKKLAEISSSNEIEEVLTQIQNQYPNEIVILSHPEGHFMYIGVSKDLGFLNYHESDDPPYYSSIGDKSLTIENGVKEFYLNGYQSEIPLRNCIPFETLLKAVKEYYDTSKLPTVIEWEED